MGDFLGVNSGGRYCVVPEVQIVKALVAQCWPYMALDGGEAMATREAEVALEGWVRQGLPFSHDRSTRLFDWSQVYNFMAWTGRGNGESVFEQCFIPSSRRAVCEFALADPGAPRSGRFDRARFEVVLRRQFNFDNSESEKVTRVRVPVPYEDRAQEEIDIKLLDHPAGAMRAPPTPGRLEFQLPSGPRRGQAVVEVRIGFTSYCEGFEVLPGRLLPWDTADPEYQLYTRRAEGLIRVTEPIAQLAQSLAGQACHPWEAVQAFWRFFFERMHLGFIHHDELDSADPLGSLIQRRWCDCYTGSALLAALCRARGIPARLVSGFLLFRNSSGIHYWAEVNMPPLGWLPLDLLTMNLVSGRGDSPSWSSFYLGRLDHRMKVQCFPRLILGRPAARWPRSWYMLPRLVEHGTETSFYNLETRRLLYRDRIQFSRQPV